jgi:hypothetical protein
MAGLHTIAIAKWAGSVPRCLRYVTVVTLLASIALGALVDWPVAVLYDFLDGAV